MGLRLDKKLAIDHYVGGPLAWSLNLLAQLLAPFLKRDHSLQKEPKNILFLKFIGLGSIVRASFLITSVKKRYPGAKIVFAVFPGCAPLVKLYKEVDEVIIVRDKSPVTLIIDTVTLLLWCWREGIDLVIDLEVHAKYSSLISALSLSRDRAGFAGTTSRFRRGLYTHLVFWNPIRFVDHAYLRLAEALSLPASERPPLIVPPSAQKELDDFFRRLGIAEGTVLIGINPNASELRSERRWPKESFALLIEQLPKEDCVIFIVGSPAEHSYGEEIMCLLDSSQGARVINISGKISFAAFTALLSKLSVFVTNDSGPLHLARSFDTPTVSLWGPTHPVNYSPRGPKHISLYHPIYCSPCTHASDVPPCGGDNQCLKRIPVSRVLRAVLTLLGRAEVPALTDIKEPSHDFSSYPVLGYWQRESVQLPVHKKRAP